MSRVAMCEVKSREKTTKNKPPKEKVQWSATKINGLWWTPSDVEWKNTAHPMDRMGNWCIGGCWFILAPQMYRRGLATITPSEQTLRKIAPRPCLQNLKQVKTTMLHNFVCMLDWWATQESPTSENRCKWALEYVALHRVSIKKSGAS